MSQLVRELKRKRDEEARLAQRSPLPVFQETEGGQTIKTPEQVVVEAVTALNNLKNAVTLQAGDNVTVTVNGQTITISGPTPGAEVFLGLEDTPGTYIGEAGRVVKVNSMEDGLEFADESGGGGSYTLPQATESTLGGIKAAEKTAAETTPAKIDPATGIMYVPPADAAANGLPAGGIAGQVLAKASSVDYDTEWIDAPSGGGEWSFGFVPLPLSLSTANYAIE